MKIREDYTCPLEIAHDIMKGKWKPIILFQLQWGPASLSALERSIAGISQKMLLQQLKELQEFGLVDKSSFEGYPLRVEYTLTPDRGRRMLEAVRIMQQIGVDIMVEQGLTDFLDRKGIVYPKK
ncbi:helix-turn-helix domain-containing protein [Paenibacillus sp. YN15]|uniref:winged helix-turn-helix transcriptional regulator n=1 Tax=Paenibacillus sp. YN15 TaxID=1742774 RepID=UPI000DCCCE40|nr:helix-turn-helix domain-containing protein [Paenibacillus sp. YN15]RAV06561.1 transcriptional regulator [Paenibacillus sp. YN15]